MTRRAIRLAIAAAAVAAAAACMASGVERGRALYEGRVPLALVSGAPAPACVSCHRPSGMGNFEGGLAVPAIAGPTLFQPWDRDTAHFFAASGAYRLRPAYENASLGTLLRHGTAPDGVTMRAAMPRYRIDDAALDDLSEYLQQLSARAPAGLDAATVRIATVSTPDADPQRRDAMLATLQRFVALKNAQTRHERRRLDQAARTREMAMYRKFRVWSLEHWALEGDPSTWAAQLDAHQLRTPVYALVAGVGGLHWAPVDAFCDRHRLPCLLPQTRASVTPSAYALRFHGGLAFDATIAAQALRARGVAKYRLNGVEPGSAASAILRAALDAEGLQEAATGDPRAASVSLELPAAGRGAGEAPSVWLAGDRAIDADELGRAAAAIGEGLIVTPMRSGEALESQLERTRRWLRTQRLDGVPADVAASTLHAATALGEGLAHVDFGFTPEYLLELLEHSLESLVPWSPYPRLALGPGQRVASKGSLVGVVSGGRVAWQWQARE